ncbi:MAG: isoprenyl transferase [Desulfobulbus sp.]|uniref:isoprenyl transferase n=1 Tax=Desulfobulbus sp. TaxID=895 RepID=UPI0028497C03|nr:isoprenyl transferase [Desulfobulbus sp.]MDR2550068.1 isoprenyl transferase [Desulfobulbus sp.]
MDAPDQHNLVPRHVAIIMDGNGRWAEERHRPRLFGHKAGVESVREIVEVAREIGVAFLTLYAFSTENWNRPNLEVSGLMTLLKSYLQSELRTMLRNDIRLRCLGEQDRLPEDVRSVLRQAIADTNSCRGMTLNLALSYGGRSELVGAVREMARKCLEGSLDWNALSETDISDHLFTAGQPDPDLLIRTGGEHRLSNFLLWQASYAELYFTEIRWPDFRKQQFLDAIQTFNLRQRRFGRTGAQVTGE